jgi:vacuolar-type H+-ATPase subunit I/STV1
MTEELKYALVTSSALPQEIAESRFYHELDKTQWLDLVDYSEELVNKGEHKEILFLIVATGTEAQVQEDNSRRELKEQEKLQLVSRNSEMTRDLEGLQEEIADLRKVLNLKSAELQRVRDEDASEEQKAAEQKRAQEEERKALRSRSVSLFNALYQKK